MAAGTNVCCSAYSFMWLEKPSKILPMLTFTPDFGRLPQNTSVQFGSAKIASFTSCPTFRASISNAAVTRMSLGA